MTQDGGIDVLIAWCMFGVLLVLLGWVLLRHHDNPVKGALRSDGKPRAELTDDDGPDAKPQP